MGVRWERQCDVWELWLEKIGVRVERNVIKKETKLKIYICAKFLKKKSFFFGFFFATRLIFERCLAPRSQFFEKVNGLGVFGEATKRHEKGVVWSTDAKEVATH
ncbi:hypothetical protein LXL04_032215 [Taraxacum kok-saghyz]